MAHGNTILSQRLKLVPRHEFETLAKQHHSGRAFRKASRWSPFVSLTMAQLSDRNSLRDIVQLFEAMGIERDDKEKRTDWVMQEIESAIEEEKNRQQRAIEAEGQF